MGEGDARSVGDGSPDEEDRLVGVGTSGNELVVTEHAASTATRRPMVARIPGIVHLEPTADLRLRVKYYRDSVTAD